MQFLIATFTNILYYNSQNKLLKNIKRDLHQQNPNFKFLYLALGQKGNDYGEGMSLGLGTARNT